MDKITVTRIFEILDETFNKPPTIGTSIPKEWMAAGALSYIERGWKNAINEIHSRIDAESYEGDSDNAKPEGRDPV